MQTENHIFQGLRRDNHQIKQQAEFLWDAHNIRLTNRDDSTLLSITNEKGPSFTGIGLTGQYIGHCVVGKYLIVFTSNGTSSHTIYRIEKTDAGLHQITLFHSGSRWEDGWSPEHPIEAMGIYETELVQKVYWIDGKNQPRVINVTKPELTGEYKDDRLDYTSLYDKDEFDFVRSLSLNETVTVTKGSGEGMFAPGVIQYAFSYYDKYSQETNLFYTTPLHYITYPNRGGSPEDRISAVFKIKIQNVDSFDYVRVYSIHRTSLDAVPTVKIVADIEILSNSVEILDTGTIGEIADPTYLLYIGGREIVPQCMTQKDNTLFFGNIELKEDEDFLNIKKAIEEDGAITFESYNNNKLSAQYDNPQGTYYSYGIHPELRGFKSNEWYRLGVQFQKSNGNWTEPVYLGDRIVNSRLPYVTNTMVKWYTQKIVISDSLKELLVNSGYKKVRTCVVFPTSNERTVVCQGMICPTVYSTIGRPTGSPYAMASWFIRPGSKSLLSNDRENNFLGSDIQYVHNKSILGNDNTGAEIQGVGEKNSVDISSVLDIENKDYFFIDENILTMHSPDIEFDDSIYQIDEYGSYKLHVLGFMPLAAISGDIDITTSTPEASSEAAGFIHNHIGYSVGQEGGNANGGLIAGVFYNDGVINTDYELKSVDTSTTPKPDFLINYLVYPFNRSGSLNNDVVRPADKGTRTAILEKKVISNLKYFSGFTPIGENDLTVFNIKSPQLFSSNEVELLKIWNNYLKKEVTYLGNIDSIAVPKSERWLYGKSGSGLQSVYELCGNSDKIFYKTKEATRLKYKSTPHLVFSLGKGEEDTTIYLPPASVNNGIKASGSYTIPKWDDSSNVPSTDDWDNILDICAIVKSGSSLLASDYKDRVGKYIITFEGNNLYAGYIANADSFWLATDTALTLATVHEGTIMRIKGDSSTNLTVGNPLLEPNENIFEGVGATVGTYSGEDMYYRVESVSGTAATAVKIELSQTSKPARKVKTRAGESSSTFEVKRYEVPTSIYDSDRPYVCLAELRREVSAEARFGGNSPYILKSHLWYPTSEAVDIMTGEAAFMYGDTWYSRYDCLKTYPFTKEDENQIVEIGSFMCETRVNIDGRYDRNRGQVSNLNMSPENFNLINRVYSQKDNFFNYRILDEVYYKNSIYGNQIIWSKTKTLGEDIDVWTNVTMANTLDIDGNRGKIISLKTLNDDILYFQEQAIGQILFNSRVQIPTADGVPIEISNSYKVDGSRVLSDAVGCQNKWSVCNTSRGIYFIDDNTDTLWFYNGQLTNLSENLGMKWWFQKNHSIGVWKPKVMQNNGIRTFNDPSFGDVYFVPGPENTERDAICFSEQLGQFVSQYSYGGTEAMFQFGESFMSLRHEGANTRLWSNFDGKYNIFFGVPKKWDMTFISNEGPTTTKIFDTLELRADSFNPNLIGEKYSTKVQEGQPLDFIRVRNEYQDTRIYEEGRPKDVRFNASTLRKKFRVWRALIPRNKLNSNGRDRIRNLWAEITIGCNNPGETLTVLHDVSVKYTV